MRRDRESKFNGKNERISSVKPGTASKSTVTWPRATTHDKKVAKTRPELHAQPVHGNYQRSDFKMVERSHLSEDLRRFWEQLSAKMARKQGGNQGKPLVDVNNSHDIELWKKAWSAASNSSSEVDLLNVDHLYYLVHNLLLLPNAGVVNPAADDVVGVLCRLIRELKGTLPGVSSTGHRKGDMNFVDPMRVLEGVVDLIQKRFGQLIHSCADFKALVPRLEAMSGDFCYVAGSLLQGRSVQDMRRVSSLLARGAEDFKHAIELLKRASQAQAQIIPIADEGLTSQVREGHWLGWTKPTVGWLLSTSWHQADGLRSVYRDPHEYARCLSQVWTLLTFYWGSGGLWPKCRHEQPGSNADSCCGEPLLVPSTGGRCKFRRGNEPCGATASFRCHRYGHDEICQGCLLSRQEALRGPPGPGASTDVYDALVVRETNRREGVVFLLQNLQSRKPPKIAPNWSTTYRLQCSALVAIVKLGASLESLPRDRPLQWAEVVAYSDRKQDGRQESSYRQQGQIALRLLTRGDVPALSQEVEAPLELGTRVAIIDLRVFVPEVVSVLATLSHESFSPQLREIPFINRLIGAPSPSQGGTQGFVYDRTASILANVSNALEDSEIDFVQRISAAERKVLAGRICSLSPVKSLYGTQLEAFSAALASSVHCTQGPPGTGKSYIGVCLVLALDVIRSTAEARGQSVGPVLLLSYKNHALDEFLCDTVRCQPFHPGQLVRAGKAENERLAKYSEKFTLGEKAAQEELSLRIAVQRHARKVANYWRNASSRFEDGDFLIFDEQNKSGSEQALIRRTPQLAVDSSENLRSHTIILLRALLVCHRLGCSTGMTAFGANTLTAADAFELLRFIHYLDTRNAPVECATLSACFPELAQGAVHWYDGTIEAMRPFFWLTMWLLGYTPPPRCIARDGNETQCMEHAMHPGGYCVRFHKCRSRCIGDCPGPSVSERIRLCENHRCLEPAGECPVERIGGCMYCLGHCCQGCIQARIVPVRGRLVHACEMHQCAGNQVADNDMHVFPCPRLQILPHKYCDEHLCVACFETGQVRNLPKCDRMLLCTAHKCGITGCGKRKQTLVEDVTSDYCGEHTCKGCLNDNTWPPKSVDSACPGSKYCVDHRCAHALPHCVAPRLGPLHLYCKVHSCRICLESGQPSAGPCTDDPPRNTCELHPLCSEVLKDGSMCIASAVPPHHLYCEKHSIADAVKRKAPSPASAGGGGRIVHVRCRGITKKGNLCKNTGFLTEEGPWWCKDHLKQAPARPTATATAKAIPAPSSAPNSVALSAAASSPPPANVVNTPALDKPPASKLVAAPCLPSKSVSETTPAATVTTEDTQKRVGGAGGKDDAHFSRGDGRCSGTTKAGNRCTVNGRAADGGHWYCNGHQNQAPKKNDLPAVNTSCQPCVPATLTGAPVTPPVDELLPEKVAKDDDVTESEVAYGAVRGIFNFFSGVWTVQKKDTKEDKVPEEVPSLAAAAAGGGEEDFVNVDDEDGNVRGDTKDTDALLAAAGVDDLDELIVVEEEEETVNDKQKDPQLLPADHIPLASILSDKEEDDVAIDPLLPTDIDDTNITDALAGDVHPDELDVFDDDEAAEGIANEEQQRLRDMIDVESEEEDSEGDEDEEDKITTLRHTQRRKDAYKTVGGFGDAAAADGTEMLSKQDEQQAETEDRVTVPALPDGWTWEMSVDVRHRAAGRFLSKMTDCIIAVRQAAEPHITAARKLRAEAGAQAFRSARIVGATVVGAARRLEALRAAEPFAVVVEEACEVMEPTLISVLAVRSLRKLELIGDHRQLPAFVQNCWYNLETSLPSIKTSLFERLISGRVGGEGGRNRGSFQQLEAAPINHTILDEQRRMCKTIADITRPDYEDIVTITDHPQTHQQRVGDAALRGKLVREDLMKLHRQLLQGPLQSIPGVLPSVFFWNIAGNKEGRPKAGLSACNPTEASAVVALTQYLLLCGVPEASISIITPYKGQKTEIISQLRKAKCLPPFRPAGKPSESSERNITVSTVDRYQGDENDIVLLSLVRTAPGNRFVALKNRFIVATSRARLGFYIIGSLDAVAKENDSNGRQGPPHWRRFVATLRDTNKSTQVDSVEGHHNLAGAAAVVAEEGEVADDELVDDNGNNDDTGDGREVATLCGLVQDPLDYAESRVGSALPISCPRHRDSARKTVSKPADFPTIESWNKFCCAPCTYTIPLCLHQCPKTCHSPGKVPHATQKDCRTPVPRPCLEHESVELLCKQLSFNVGDTLERALRNFKCNVSVSYIRPECDHRVKMECHEAKAVSKGTMRLPDCQLVVSDFVHPACNHVIAKPKCVERRKYERSPPQCDITVQHQRPCGCTVEIQCYEKMRELASPVICQRSVDMQRPRCNHILSVRCHIRDELLSSWEDSHGEPITTISELKTRGGTIEQRIVIHGRPYGPPENTLMTQYRVAICQVPVAYRGSCGHVFPAELPCHQAFEVALGRTPEPRCGVTVQMHSPLCGHDIKIPCWAAQHLRDWRPWGESGFADIISEGMLGAGAAISEAVNKVITRACTRSVSVTRSCGREHTDAVQCSDLLSLLAGKSRLPPCKHLVDRILPCSHVACVPCSTQGDPPPICNVAVKERFVYPCGEHSISGEKCSKLTRLRTTLNPECPFLVSCRRYRCGHQVMVKCSLRETVTSSLPGEHLEPVADYTDASAAEDGVDHLDRQALVVADTLYCASPSCLNECTVPVRFQLPCGHVIANVPCARAFEWALGDAPVPKCHEMVEKVSPLCGHTVQVSCPLTDTLAAWKPWGDGVKPACEMISIADAHGDVTAVEVVRYNDAQIQNEPPDVLPAEALNCESIGVAFMQPCGHSKILRCADAYLRRCPPCVEQVPVVCQNPEYRHEITRVCHEYEADKAAGKVPPCRNKVNKTCTVCRINKTSVECGKTETECHRKVTAKLVCGHEITWTCGRHEDPRLKAPMEVCRLCVLPLWAAAVQYFPTNADADHFEHQSRLLLNDSLASAGVVIDCQDIQLAYRNYFFWNKHMLMRQRLLTAYKDLLDDPKNDLVLSPPPPPLSSPMSIGSYDIVYRPIHGKTNWQQAANLFDQIGATSYGTGSKYFLLTPASLKKVPVSDDGHVRVCLGLAFRHRCLEGTAPFRLETEDSKGKKEKANKAAKQKQGQGFDCVDVFDRNVQEGDVNERVYWYPASALPLAYVTLQLHTQCVICHEFYTRNQGFFCNKGHFVCWDECFDAYVKSASEPGAVGRSVDKEGNLNCPECNDRYDLHAVANCGGPKHVFEALFNLRTNAITQSILSTALDDQKARLTEEFERIQRIQDLDLRQASLVRMKLIEDVLNLRCPRCKAVFADFDGCFALTCHRNECRAGICAWCLKDCGQDAHAHVAHCPESHQRGYFGTLQQFNEHHRQRRQRIVRDRINQEPPAVQAHLRRIMAVELRDLGIQ